MRLAVGAPSGTSPIQSLRAPSHRRAVLLTWNPDRWDWGTDYLKAIESTESGEAVLERWSTGGRRSGLRHGDRAYLLRQGVEPRGIVAAGWVTAEIETGPHFDGTGGTANYVPVDWDAVLAPDECLATGELKGELPSQDWAPQGSGTLVRPENVGRLDELWSDWLDAMFGARGAERGTGNATVAKGRQLDSTQRKKIEDAAQDRLMGLYRNDGWAVCDTRHGHPYDAVANRKGSRRYLEAKGTTTPGTSVILSRNEVTHARDHPGEWVIGIWSGMRFLDDGEVDPDSGHFQVLELTPDDDDLQVIDYRWSLPAQ